MKFFDVGEHAVGVIAIGQHATGVFALGQDAVGVIAIGQLARGGFAVGQLAVGIVGWGQAGVGVLHSVGMVGIAARAGIGLVLPLTPSVGKPRLKMDTQPLEQVVKSMSGWIDAEFGVDRDGFTLSHKGQRLRTKFDRRLLRDAGPLVVSGPRHVAASLRCVGNDYVCDRIVYHPEAASKRRGWWISGAFQFLALVGIAVLFWAVVGTPLAQFFATFAAEGIAR